MTFESGVEVFAKRQDPADEENYYGWQVNGIYLIETPLSAFVDPASCLYDLDDFGCCNRMLD